VAANIAREREPAGGCRGWQMEALDRGATSARRKGWRGAHLLLAELLRSISLQHGIEGLVLLGAHEVLHRLCRATNQRAQFRTSQGRWRGGVPRHRDELRSGSNCAVMHLQKIRHGERQILHLAAPPTPRLAGQRAGDALMSGVAPPASGWHKIT
jgi:hypothetical protein